MGAAPIDQITPDMVDEALLAVSQRGKKPLRKKELCVPLRASIIAGIARYFSEVAGCFKYAKKQKLISRNWVPPTRVADLPKQNGPDQRYFDNSQVANLVKIARMLDKSWVHITALIQLVFCTVLRSGGLKSLISSDGDLAAGVLTVEPTKNGDPIIVLL